MIQMNVRRTYVNDTWLVLWNPYWFVLMSYLRETEEERGW